MVLFRNASYVVGGLIGVAVYFGLLPVWNDLEIIKRHEFHASPASQHQVYSLELSSKEPFDGERMAFYAGPRHATRGLSGTLEEAVALGPDSIVCVGERSLRTFSLSLVEASAKDGDMFYCGGSHLDYPLPETRPLTPTLRQSVFGELAGQLTNKSSQD